MCLVDPSFVDVRTAGSLGDVGSDGLLINNRKLYACYAPEVFDVDTADKVAKKFNGDLTKAREKRNGQFDTFVFAHNDMRGMHPVLSAQLPAAKTAHPNLSFEFIGFRHMRDMVNGLDRHQVEDLLGMQLPVDQLVFGLAQEELEPLLAHLSQLRVRYDTPDAPLQPVSSRKLTYNEFSEDVREELRLAMVSSPDIERYYANRLDINERDEVANGFNIEYQRLLEGLPSPDDVFYYLEQYVLGNQFPPLSLRRAAIAVIAYFFQTCDVFEDAPPDWIDPEASKASA